MTIGPRCKSVHGWRRGPPGDYLQNCSTVGIVPEPQITKLLTALAAAEKPRAPASTTPFFGGESGGRALRRFNSWDRSSTHPEVT